MYSAITAVKGHVRGLIIRTFQLIFLTERVFFSHNKSTETKQYFGSFFQRSQEGQNVIGIGYTCAPAGAVSARTAGLNGRCVNQPTYPVVHDRAQPFAEPRLFTAVLPAAAACISIIHASITTRILLPGRIASYSISQGICIHVCGRPRISRRARDWLLGLPPSCLHQRRSRLLSARVHHMCFAVACMMQVWSGEW